MILQNLMMVHRGESLQAYGALVDDARQEFRQGTSLPEILENLFDVPRHDKEAEADLFSEILRSAVN